MQWPPSPPLAHFAYRHVKDGAAGTTQHGAHEQQTRRLFYSTYQTPRCCGHEAVMRLALVYFCYMLLRK
jgi:hypothetical protein